MSVEKAKELMKKMPEVQIDKDDLKRLALDILYEIDGKSAQHARAKIEALRLLSEFVIDKKKDDDDFGEAQILHLLSGGKK